MFSNIKNLSLGFLVIQKKSESLQKKLKLVKVTKLQTNIVSAVFFKYIRENYVLQSL